MIERKSEKGKLEAKCLLACLPGERNFPREFTENCFAIFDQSSHIILLLWYCRLSREFHVAISWMDLSKIFDKTIGGEYNSISLHFCKLRQHVFIFISKLRC